MGRMQSAQCSESLSFVLSLGVQEPHTAWWMQARALVPPLISTVRNEGKPGRLRPRMMVALVPETKSVPPPAPTASLQGLPLEADFTRGCRRGKQGSRDMEEWRSGAQEWHAPM